MISIDRQPWAHRGGPAFVTSKLNPIADPRRSLMNWPRSPSLFNWWRVPFQVDHHYVPRIHWFSNPPPLSPNFFFPLSSSTQLQKTNPPPPQLDLGDMARRVSLSLLLTSQLDFQRWIYSASLLVKRPSRRINLKVLWEVSKSQVSAHIPQRRDEAVSWKLY